MTAEVDPVGTDLLPVESVAEVLAAHEHEYERRTYPAHYCTCGWDGAQGDDGGPNDGTGDTAEAQRAHTAAALQPLIDAEKAEAVREALDELIEAHTETFGPAGSASRMWLRERRAALEQR
jgi:hypothetical protein